jgi:hypothetical protein
VAGPERELLDLLEAGGDARQRLPGLMPFPQRSETRKSHMSFGISPVLGSLAPGDEALIYAVLVAVPAREKLERAIDDAFRTVVGDGTNRMVPPPVSITRRIVHGTYKIEADLAGELVIRLDNLREEGLSALDISGLSGIDIKQFRRLESFSGSVYYEKLGEYPEVFNSGERIEMRGRLTNGGVFDVVLEPEMFLGGNGAFALTEEQYWNQQGKLEETLLSGSPNPFREMTTIYYEVPSSLSEENGTVFTFSASVETSVKVYGVTGRLVSVLVEEFHNPGTYNVPWNALDDNGQNVASGVYYVKLQIGKKHITKRLIQLK